MRMCLFPLQVSMPELLGWSVELKRQESEVREEEENPFTRELQLINHLNAVIAQLVETNKAQSERIAELEKRVPVGGAVAPQAGSTPDTITDRTDLSLALDTPMKPTKPKQTGRRIEDLHVLAWRSSRRPSLRQLPSTGANASHEAAHESTQAREANSNLAPVNTPLGAEENGGAVATIAAATAWARTVENPASTAAEAIPTSTAAEATPAVTTAATLAAVPAAEGKLSVAAIAVAKEKVTTIAEEKVTTAAIDVAEVKLTTAASSADAAQPLADSGDDSSDDDVVWIPAPSGLPVTTGTGSVLNADDGRADSEASETERFPTENLAAPPSTAPQLYDIRAITNSYMRNVDGICTTDATQPLSVEPSLKTKLATAVDDFETRNLHQSAAVADHFEDFAELFTSR
ncbi:hypothetical protein PF008_g19222 [Phytophthora fragariae]|uniref:Uncharacterized protein n=1 Tax=Phytophthora fragariae TaxID=53985 RepID=A0A6G0R310_9STRA|nr:hypothetical protein PF008_g19222 [Phytophthora fragariae]